MSRCKQSSNQSQPIVILMLVRLNGKSVYRSLLSLCHTHAHSLSLSPPSIGPNEQFDTIQGLRYSNSFSFFFPFFFFFNLSLGWPITLNDRQRTFFFFCRTAIPSKCFRGQQDVSSRRVESSEAWQEKTR